MRDSDKVEKCMMGRMIGVCICPCKLVYDNLCIDYANRVGENNSILL